MAEFLDDSDEIDPDADVGVTFRELGLAPKILKALDDMGYETPTPIQARAIPFALQNRDVLGIAQTGTGKTGAFTLPTVHKLSRGRARARMPRCLIICPTRELAAQVAENVESYGKYLKLEMALLIGGVSFAEQNKKLDKGVDVLIATPGRLLDQFERGKILLTGVETLVVDEADRMLDMGFIPDIERIFQLTPFTRQVLFFSATMPNEIKRLVDQFLHQPATIQVARKNMTADTVRERIVRLPTSDAKVKRTTLRWLIDNLENNNDTANNGIIFCNRKKDVDVVAKSLGKHGYKAAPIHGDLPQSVRMATLEKFKSGELNWLVASDVAARGLDIPDVSFVFNYDVPHHAEDYVHRIGRTGRAGKKGDAVMLVARLDGKSFDAILELTKRQEIEELDVDGIDDFASGGRDSSRGRSSGRGRDSGKSSARGSSRGGRSRSRGEPREKPPRQEKPVPKAAPARQAKKADGKVSRRKAPGRKTPKPEDADVAQTKPARAESDTKAPSSRRSAPKRDGSSKAKPQSSGSRGRAKPSDTSSDSRDEPRRESSNRSSRRGSSRTDSRGDSRGGKRNSERSNSRNSGKGDGNRKGRGSSIGKADSPGFGSDVPDFFSR